MKTLRFPRILFYLLMTLLLCHNAYATPVNINKADAKLIASSLTGIGKHKAKAIIYYRNKNGLFKRASDIVNVKGIGNATYRKNKTDILVR